MRILGTAMLPLLAVVAFVAGRLQRPVPRTHADLADLLELRAKNRVSDDEWDDFLCIPVADPRLDEIRRACVTWEERGDQDVEFLRRFVQRLREA